MLVLLALEAGVQMALGKVERNLAYMATLVLHVLGSFSAFVWYCRDSDARSYRRSLWRNMLFNGVALLFVPWYLVRTRPGGKRLAAIMNFAGFCALMLLALIIGSALGLLFGALV
ncbi:MAG: hypothetical protein WKG03_06020 [Telluria sp.]